MPAPAQPNKLSPKHILVVEDDPRVANTLRMVLGIDGHTVEIAENAEQGMRMFDAGKFDIVVTDYALGKLTGLDLAKYIKGKFPKHPIILITAYAEPLRLEEGRLADIDAVIGKPFALDELQSALAKLFEGV